MSKPCACCTYYFFHVRFVSIELHRTRALLLLRQDFYAMLRLVRTFLYEVHNVASTLPHGFAEDPASYQTSKVSSQVHPLMFYWELPESLPADHVPRDESSATLPKRITGISQCTLCFEPCIQTSCTPCGHLYCWSCIWHWLRVKQQCPLCRQQVNTGDIIPLINYT